MGKKKNVNKNQEDSPSLYREKIWGGTEGGEYIIDGYTLRGKKAFGKAREGLYEYLKKGVARDVNGIKLKALDVRKNGAGIDIEVELVENNARGIGVVKLYGPSLKNENVIMVSKSKQSEHKYVKTLADKVIKPLIRDFLADNIDLNDSEESLTDSEAESLPPPVVFKCPFCDKTSYSSPGLKCHVTKMHKGKTLNENKPNEEVVNDIMEQLLDDSMITLEDRESKKVTLEESIGVIDEQRSPSKMYRHECKNCEYVSEAGKNYVALQQMLKHEKTDCSKKIRKSLKIGQCYICEMTLKNRGEMRRHMRDEHCIITDSTSPPPKKAKLKAKGSLELE